MEIEVLMLMEFCSCSLLDYMNRNGLRTEQDILQVFADISFLKRGHLIVSTIGDK